MRKTLSAMLLAGTMALSSGYATSKDLASNNAEDSTRNIPYIKLSAGLMRTPDSNIVRHIPRFNLDIPGKARFGSGKNYSGALGVLFGSTNIAAELEMNVGSFPMRSVNLNGLEIPSEGTIRQVAAILNVYYRIPINDTQFTIYGGVGGGGMVTNTFKPRIGTEDLGDEVKGRFVHQFMGGVEYRLNRNLSFGTEYKFRKTPTLPFNEFSATYKGHILSANIIYRM